MKRSLAVFAFVSLFCGQAFATYMIVTRDGTTYKAKAKWTITNGKALVTLETGQTLTLNPNEIDVAKTDQMNKMGLGDVHVLSSTDTQPPQQQPKNVSSLGSVAKLRRPPTSTGAATSTAPAPVADQLDGRLRDTFERAYENVGIFEHKLTGTNRNVRVELIADSEEKAFMAISATALLVVRNAGLQSSQIDIVELFMGTTNGGSAGRFMMNRADAEGVYNKSTSIEDYYIRKVIY
jgi:hypothetical protein